MKLRCFAKGLSLMLQDKAVLRECLFLEPVDVFK
jgi:hypothetical protein